MTRSHTSLHSPSVKAPANTAEVGSRIYDVVGVGFGPSNLALAVAITEESSPTEMTFLEAQQRFGWHGGMLLDGTTMQVSFLKDLATQRRPTSEYSFVNFLSERGRLAEFINGKTLYPLRLEYHEYLEWAASRLSEHVEFGLEVMRITPVKSGSHIQLLDVVARDRGTGEIVTRRARNVVIAPGLQPKLPSGVVESTRVWHSSRLRYRLETWEVERPWRFAVAGAGQSAAEVVHHLHARFPRANVDAVHARYGYSVADDSPFANAIFNPEAVDAIFESPAAVKKSLHAYHQNTNYGVVDLDLSRALHSILYEELVSGTARLHIRRATSVRSATEDSDCVTVEFESPAKGGMEMSTVAYDAVIFATGYEPISPMHFLGELSDHIMLDDDGAFDLTRDYRLATTDHLQAGIFVQGPAAERSHGLTAGLLSTIAVRAGEIASAIETGRHRHSPGHSM